MTRIVSGQIIARQTATIGTRDVRGHTVTAMRNPLHEQLLKAGLVKKDKVAAAVREQNRQRQGKAVAATVEAVDTRQLHAERVERDRALAAEQKALTRQKELRAQIRQIVATHKVARAGDIEYRFVDADAMRTVYVNTALRTQLAKGALVIVADGDGYELVPRAAADMIRERGGSIAVDHGSDTTSTPISDDDAHYAQFKVPDDLIW